MIEFILNNHHIKTDEKAGSTLLDFVRYHQNLTGTKIGCREGDCGACTLLMGQLVNGDMVYKSLTSCITPLGNAQGKHIVSIEGLNSEGLTPYQQAMVDTSGSQCGMCTPGFIVSFAGACLSHAPMTYDTVISAIDGNICRCTGYKSIERAAKIVVEKLAGRPKNNWIPWLAENQFIPEYFNSIPGYINQIKSPNQKKGDILIGGGTDLLVQKHDEISAASVDLVSDLNQLIGIEQKGNEIHVRAATNTTDLVESDIMQQMIPNLWKYIKLVSSTPIRNIATVGGNLINASPIGDLTAMFLALNSRVLLKNKTNDEREVLLKDFYTGYKIFDLHEGEYLDTILFIVLDEDSQFNFEKVSKRRHLDIATVNSGMRIRVADNIITDIHISAGGVGPTPKYLHITCEYLTNRPLDINSVMKALDIAQQEISPISDVRGSEKYKRLLLRQLLFAHFIELFPNKFNLDLLHEKH